MVNSLRNSSVVWILVVILLIVVSVPFQNRIDDIRGKFRSIEETLYFSSSALEKISLGYKEILADIYWLRALQYFGGTKFQEQNPELLYHYFDILTDLDPKFVNAYRYGGTFLSEPEPLGLGDIERGMILFDKGRMNNPDNFRLPLEQGFLAFLYLKDYEKASELFYEASEKPILSDRRRASIRGMAALALSKGGERELSIQIWKTIYETTENEGRRKHALKNLKVLETKDKEDFLTSALSDYLDRFGSLPKNLTVLVEAEIIRKIPKDPFGGEFIIVNKLNAVRSSTLLNEELRYNRLYLSSRARRFRQSYNRYPYDINELKAYVDDNPAFEFPPHPLGEEYVYDPQTGKVRSN
ncbi:hypothetical protein MYX76_02545 [Desulfobacterota bacterium AH_259_B03_O07]|nr:hypothetical protein [Desulfobacterota bacterium AH_259_B03_O07]